MKLNCEVCKGYRVSIQASYTNCLTQIILCEISTVWYSVKVYSNFVALITANQRPACTNIVYFAY